MKIWCDKMYAFDFNLYKHNVKIHHKRNFQKHFNSELSSNVIMVTYNPIIITF